MKTTAYWICRTPKRERWLVVDPLKLIYIRVNKSACSTLASTIHARWGNVDSHYEWPTQALPYLPEYKTVMMWRDPMKRMASAYAFLGIKQREEYVINHNIPPCTLPYDEWVREILTVSDRMRDPHICAQSGHYAKPDIVVPWNFERFRQLFDLPQMEVHNPGPRPPPVASADTYARMRKDVAYRQDFEMWEKYSRWSFQD